MAVTFLLLAQVFEVSALAPVEESLMDSPLGSRAEIGWDRDVTLKAGEG
jgi:hypothetical protein